MGIFDLFKKKKVEKPDVSDMFDNMSRQMFYRYEAAYRHQKIVLPRFKSETGILIGDIIKQVLPDLVSHIDNMSVLITVHENEIVTKHQYITNEEEVLSYNLFWNIFYKKEDSDEIYPITGTNVTLTIRTNDESVPPYLVLFVRGMVIGFDETYIRIALMIPPNVEKDDLRTTKSNSTSTMTSFLIACDLKENPKQFEEYEEAEKRVRDCLHFGKPLRDDIDRELFYGFREFKPYFHYHNYGKYLYDNQRYNDACGEFMRAINYLKANLDKNNMSDYYEICRLTARCLMQHNHYEMAGYYLSLAYSGGVVTEEENEKFWIAIADIRSIDFVCANLMNKFGNDIEKWPQDAKEKYNRVFYQYKKNCDDDRERYDKVTFWSESCVSLILTRLLDIKENNICGINIISPEGNITTIKDKKQFLNDSIYEYLIPGTTIVLPYSKAYYATGDEEDKSMLCHASSIILYIDSADTEKNLVRVNIMIPNFNNDDDNHRFSETNDPWGVSFIMSSVDEPKMSDVESLETIYDYANKCVKQSRIYEAHIAYIFIYKKLSVKRLTLSEEERDLFYKCAYCLGFCMEELQLHEKALFYLELANNSGIDTHEQEYINALVNNRDPRALDVIKDAKKKKYDADPNSEAFQVRNAFLNRREAYVLIDQEKYDEAEILLKEMLNNPMSKEFAEGELKYVEQMKQQRS